MPIKACKTELEKKTFFQKKFWRYKLSDKAKNFIFSALQTFGHMVAVTYYFALFGCRNFGLIKSFKI